MGRLFDAYYKQASRHAYDCRNPASRARRLVKLRLAEAEPGGDPIQQYAHILLAAKEYFDRRAGETIDLPEDSTEKLKIQAASGLLQQYTINIGEEVSPKHIRDHAEILSDKMAIMFDDREMQDPTRAFADKFAQNLRAFAVTIDPTEPEPEEPSPEPVGEPAGDESDGEPDEPADDEPADDEGDESGDGEATPDFSKAIEAIK